MTVAQPDTPSITRQLLGHALRTYRQQRGFNLDDAAQVLECDRSKVSRIETGHRGIRVHELKLLLEEYGANEETTATFALLSNPNGPWRQYSEVLHPSVINSMILEACASHITVYGARQIPPMLQTPDYARMMAEADASPDDDAVIIAGEVAEIRGASLRQGGAVVHAVIGEGAIRHKFGTNVMYHQVCEVSRLQVHPYGLRIVPDHLADDPLPWASSLVHYDFGPVTALPDVVAVGGPVGPIFLMDLEATARCKAALNRMRGHALPASKQARLLDELTAR